VEALARAASGAEERLVKNLPLPPSEPVLWVCSLVGASPPRFCRVRARTGYAARAEAASWFGVTHADVVALPEAP
jgi:hypothetical protein